MFLFPPFWGIFFILIFSVPAQAGMADRACEGTGTVNITDVFDKPLVKTNGSLSDLQRIRQDKERTIPRFDRVTLGMTSYEPVLSVQATLMTKRFRDGSSCSRLGSVNVQHGYRRTAVFVADAFPEGSCAYKHVLAHEMRHVEANKDLVREFNYTIKSNIEAFLRMHGVNYNADTAMLQRELQQRIQAVAEQSVLQMRSANVDRQRAIDSPQEYGKVKTACDGAMQREVDAYLESQRPWWKRLLGLN